MPEVRAWSDRAFSLASVAVAATAALTLVGILDYLTGYEISFAVFYLVPVGIAAWCAGRPLGFAFSMSSALVWYIAERAAGYPYHHAAIPIWNASVRLSFFLIIALLLSALRERLAAERNLARLDTLTGALNGRAFVERLDHDLVLAARARTPLTLAYIDLDDFKGINDVFGHGAGDLVLRSVTRALTEGTRRADSVARLGGDEFAVILPGTDLDGAMHIMSKLAGKLNESLEPAIRPVSCSIGAVVFREQPRDATDAVAAADRLMYEAKSRGKNAIVFGVYSASTLEIVQ